MAKKAPLRPLPTSRTSAKSAGAPNSNPTEEDNMKSLPNTDPDAAAQVAPGSPATSPKAAPAPQAESKALSKREFFDSNGTKVDDDNPTVTVGRFTWVASGSSFSFDASKLSTERLRQMALRCFMIESGIAANTFSKASGFADQRDPKYDAIPGIKAKWERFIETGEWTEKRRGPKTAEIDIPTLLLAISDEVLKRKGVPQSEAGRSASIQKVGTTQESARAFLKANGHVKPFYDLRVGKLPKSKPTTDLD